jgi:uncharacterized damage-inducible protein DinB
MTHEDRPAGANVHYLEQGVDLIRRLNDETYSNSPESPYPGGVGAQFRHCLDFYDCFLRGLESGQIDYGRRERDTRVENDRHHAIARFQEVSEQLAALSAEHLERPVRVKAEDAARGAPEWGCSSPARELQFLVSHTIHHYALVAVLLKAQACEIGQEFPDFGVAPSTLSYWKEVAS